MFRNLIKERELIDRELAVYFQEEKNKIDKKINELANQCVVDIRKYERTYHAKMEELGIEIAKLEALKEVMVNDVNTYKTFVKEKNLEIERMNKIVLALSNTQGTVNVVK